MKKYLAYIFPALAMVAFVAGGVVIGHRMWPQIHTVSTDAWGGICASQQRILITDDGSTPTLTTDGFQVPGLPMRYVGNSSALATVDSDWPREVIAGGSFPRDDQQRIGVIDVSPVGHVTYAMTGLPRSASNMALSQALARQFINTLGAGKVTCSAKYWVGPNLPGELASLEITGTDGTVTTAALAVVGEPDARVVIFTRGNSEYPIDADAVLQLGRAMHYDANAGA